MGTGIKLLWTILAFGIIAAVVGLMAIDVPAPTQPVVKIIPTEPFIR